MMEALVKSRAAALVREAFEADVNRRATAAAAVVADANRHNHNGGGGGGGGRRLSTDDFAALNELLAATEITIPDQSFFDPLECASCTIGICPLCTKVPGDVWADIKNLKCSGSKIGHIALASEAKSSTLVDLRLTATGITATCSLDWAAWFGDVDSKAHPTSSDCSNWLIFCGSGSAQVTAQNVGAQVKFGVQSPDFATRPPHSAVVEGFDLTLAFSIDKLEGTLASFWDLIKGAFGKLITDLVAKEVEEAVEADVGLLITGLMTEALKNASDLVTPYLAPPPARDLAATEDAILPAGAPLRRGDETLMTWQDNQEIMKAVVFVIEDQLAAPSTCSNAASPTLGINELMDGMLNNTKGEIDVPISERIATMSDAVTQTNMTLTRVRVEGLNTFTKLEILKTVGRFTSVHAMDIDRTAVEVHMNLAMLPGSLISKGLGTPVIQDLVLHVGIHQLSAMVAALLAVDTTALGRIGLASLMTDPVPCALSALYALNVTQMVLALKDFNPPPNIDGFISTGIDTLLNEGVKAVMLLYKGTMVKAMPHASDVLIRPLANTMVGTFMGGDAADMVCPDPLAAAAAAAGASAPATGGGGPINFQDSKGLATAADIINNKVGVTGCRYLNTFIGAACKSQSGVAGKILMPGSLVDLDVDEPDIGKIKVKVSDLQLSGLATFYHMDLLHATGPHTLAQLSVPRQCLAVAWLSLPPSSLV